MISCPICFDDFGENSDISSTKCGHIFHTTCIARSFTEQYNTKKCPSCNQQTDVHKVFPRFSGDGDSAKQSNELRQLRLRCSELEEQLTVQALSAQEIFDSQIQNLLEQNKELEEEKNMYSSGQSAMFERCKTLAESNKELEEENRLMITNNSMLFERCEKLEEHNQQLKGENKSLEMLKDKTFNTLTFNIKAQQDHSKTLLEKIVNLENELFEKNIKVKIFEDRVEALIKENDLLKNQRGNFRNKDSNNNDLQSIIEQFESVIADQSREIENLGLKHTSMQKDLLSSIKGVVKKPTRNYNREFSLLRKKGFEVLKDSGKFIAKNDEIAVEIVCGEDNWCFVVD